jgi:RNA polymerase sigma-70 factor (ECF subfamily)
VTHTSDPSGLVEHLFRHQAGRLVARLTHLFGPANVSLAEETVQEALIRALQTWPYQGVPENAAGWLFRVAHNLAVDAVRRDRTFAGKAETLVAELTRSSLVEPDEALVEEQFRDDELRMIFMCCHPDVPRDSRVALSLKAIGGFSVGEIARAFLCEEPTIAQRIVRAKRQIRERRLTMDLPGAGELRRRLDSVLDVLYFMFNEGYAAHEGEALIRQDLCFEALRLARLVAASSLAEPRAHALVALIALQAARFPARVSEAGDLVLLEDQDRALWDRRLIALGFRHFDLSMSGSEVSEFHVQAAIAATYARAEDPASVAWPIILELYDQLLQLNASPVVALNRAVVVSKVLGPEEALRIVETIEGDRLLRHYHLLLAVKGRLLQELGRSADAAVCFRSALQAARCEPERRFLERRLKECEASSTAAGSQIGRVL